jgi:hypothetical protein
MSKFKKIFITFKETMLKLKSTVLVKKLKKVIGNFEVGFFLISFLYFSLRYNNQQKVNERSFSE